MRHVTSEEMKNRAGTTWLIYGAFGVGKTPLASAFPDPWFWDCEAGSGSVLQPVRITVPESWGDIMAMGQAVQTAQNNTIKIGTMSFPCRTIVIDTMGEFARIMLGAIKGVKETATLPDWGLMIERFRNITRMLRDQRDRGFNIVFVAHEQYLKADESQLILGLPDLPGKELPVDLPKLCDFVVRMQARKGAQGQVERLLQTEPTGQFAARDRYGKLAGTEIVPSFKDLSAVQGLLKKAGVNF